MQPNSPTVCRAHLKLVNACQCRGPPETIISLAEMQWHVMHATKLPFGKVGTNLECAFMIHLPLLSAQIWLFVLHGAIPTVGRAILNHSDGAIASFENFRWHRTCALSPSPPMP